MTKTLNDEALRLKMSRLVEHLKSKRIFRPLQVKGEANLTTGNGWVDVTITDGLYRFSTKPFHFNIALIEYEVLAGELEKLLVESFRAHVRTMLLPDEPIYGVDVVKDETDGEERYVFQ